MTQSRASGFKHRLKTRLKETRFSWLRDWNRAYFDWRRHIAETAGDRRWVKKGRPPLPPPFHKQGVLRAADFRFGIRVFVENGTFEGEMVGSVLRDFDEINTIELDSMLGAQAAARFLDLRHVCVIQEDSVEVLPQLLGNTCEPATFWLDAQVSGGQTARGEPERPIMKELAATASHALRKEHVIPVGDARQFSGGAHPTTSQLRHWAGPNGHESVELEDDIIRIVNRRRAQ